MQKVIYSITRSTGKRSSTKKGFGYIDGNDIVIYHYNEEIKRYADILTHCRPKLNAPNQFIGNFYEIEEIEVEVKNSYETIEIEVNYDVWLKKI